MSASYTSLDTTVGVQIGLVDRWRALSPAERFDEVAALNDSCLRMAEAGVRHRYPAAADDEVRLRVLALYLGRELMIRVYGWDPDLEGW